MNHTPEIKSAVQFAARKHHGQMRMEAEPLPYVTHLFSTALLIAEDHDDDEVVIAALLHDVIEDTGTTKEEVAQTFGKRVAEIVATVSEPKEIGGKKLEWRERKKQYLTQLALGTNDALLVSIADKIDNIESKLESLTKEGPGFLQHWSQPSESYSWFHGAVLNLAQERLPEHALTKRLAQAVKKEDKVYQILARA